MIVVMTSKWVGEAIAQDGIYSAWIAMRRYPWLPPTDYHDHGETGGHLMRPVSQLTVIEDEANTVADLGMSASYPDFTFDSIRSAETFLKRCDFHGFPVVRDERLVGYITRDKLQRALGMHSCLRALEAYVDQISGQTALSQLKNDARFVASANQIQLQARYSTTCRMRSKNPFCNSERKFRRSLLFECSRDWLVSLEWPLLSACSACPRTFDTSCSLKPVNSKG